MNNEILKNAADKLEPEAKAVGEIVDTPERAIFLSIAISLKRIADVITAPPPQMPELTPEQLKQFEEVWNKSSSPFTPFI